MCLPAPGRHGSGRRAASPRFAELWARQEVRYHAAGYKRLRHPVVGQLDFRSESMTVNDTQGYIMTLYYAEPGSDTAERLAKLQALLACKASGGSFSDLMKASNSAEE